MIVMMMAAVAAMQGSGPGPVTDAQVRSARSAFDEQLLDFPSARFKDVTGNGYVLCGQVNAKNRVGAYIGWTPFAAVWREGRTSIYIQEADAEPPLVLQTFCAEGRAPVSRDFASELAGSARRGG